MNYTRFINGVYLKTIMVLSMIVGSSLCVSIEAQSSTNWFDVIMQRVQERHKAVHVSNTDNQYTKYYISILNEDGSFPDIDYTDKSQTNWKPLAHLDRMKYMILSYTLPASNYYKNEALYNQIVKMFTYWYNKHPLSTNWYNQQIAAPQRVGVMLILMRSGDKQLPTALENNLLARMASEGGRPDQSGSQGTGANKLDIATHWVYRGCLVQDESILSFGAEQVYYPIFMTTGEGLQHDYTYQQHGNQIHIGGYGFAFVDGISSIAAYMTGTPYEMSKDKLDYLSQFVRKTYVPTIRGQYFMYNVIGRAISRKGALSQAGFHTVLNRMKGMDQANAEEYDEAIARIKATEPASYALKPENKHFWRADYILHQRPEYTFDVRGATPYTTRNENGNKEGLKSYFLVDGATEIVKTGKEYIDIFGVWDWTRIPGTTTPVVSTIPLPGQWQKPGLSKFAGSASDGVYGVTTYLYNDPNYSINTSAKKAWFMFDDEIVALGTDIKSTATQEINTTVNQTLLNGDVWIKNLNKQEALLEKGKRTYSDLQWIYHNGIGYYFPQKGNINVANDSQSGAWSSINSSQSTAVESKDIFKVWFNHGVKPTSGSYEYILLPNIDRTNLNSYTSGNIQIVYNNSNMQAVINKNLDILGIVFYSAGTYESGDIKITVDKPCIVMLRDISTSRVEVYISDPSRSSSKVNLTAKFPSITETKGIECTFSTGKDPYAGSTKSYVIDSNTPKAKTIVADALVVSEDAWVRDGDSANQNVGGKTNSLIIKKDGAGYNREVYLKFDLSSIDPSEYQKYILQLAVSNSNTSISQTRWNIGYVASDNWSEETITWNNRPVTQSIFKTVAPAVAGSKLTVDITDLVLNEINKGNRVLSLHLNATERGSDGKTDAQFYSKETTDEANKPQILLQKNAETIKTQEIVPTDNTWVRDGVNFENVNNYPSSSLVIKNDQTGYTRQAYLMFDISSIDKKNIKNATLCLTVSNANTSIAQVHFGIRGTETNWTENTITYKNKPANITDVLDSRTGVAAESTISFDLTSYIRLLKENDTDKASVIVYAVDRASDNKGDVQFYAKESTATTKRPVLIVKSEDVTLGVATMRSIDLIEDNDNTISVYPNPVKKGDPINVTIASNQKNTTLSLFDATGKCVVSKTKNQSISTLNLNSGLYILKVENGGSTLNKKIIIK